MIRNTDHRYGALSMLLHWGMAAVMLGLLGLGLYMTSLPDGDPKWELYGIHKSLGLLVFLLVLARLWWQRINPKPGLPDGLQSWERKAAHGVHGYLYFAMLALPLTGYIDSSAGGYHLSFFDWFDVPRVIPKDKGLEELMVVVHQAIAYGLIAVLALHLGAVFKHHFVLKDDVLRRMLPGRIDSSR